MLLLYRIGIGLAVCSWLVALGCSPQIITPPDLSTATTSDSPSGYVALPQKAGMALTVGGVLATAPGLQVRATFGESVGGNTVTTATGITAFSGLQAIAAP